MPVAFSLPMPCGSRLICMQPLHRVPMTGRSTRQPMADLTGIGGDMPWREGGVQCPKPCLLPTVLAVSGLLLSRVLPTAASRSPSAPTA